MFGACAFLECERRETGDKRVFRILENLFLYVSVRKLLENSNLYFSLFSVPGEFINILPTLSAVQGDSYTR